MDPFRITLFPFPTLICFMFVAAICDNNNRSSTLESVNITIILREYQPQPFRPPYQELECVHEQLLLRVLRFQEYPPLSCNDEDVWTLDHGGPLVDRAIYLQVVSGHVDGGCAGGGVVRVLDLGPIRRQ
jgi:hypothetical protein